MIPKRYFIVEGKSDYAILSRLLPHALLNETKIITASGSSAALAAVRKLFSSTSLPIVLFFDTDTFSEEKIAETEQFIISYSRSKPILIPLIPHIEALLFYNKELLEKIVGHSISDELWQKGQTQPSAVCKELRINKFLESRLTPDIVAQLQENPILKGIIEKLSSLVQITTTA
jgi:hypothetical protein